MKLVDGVLSVYRDEVERYVLARMILHRGTVVEIVNISSFVHLGADSDTNKYSFAVSNSSAERVLFSVADLATLESMMMIFINASQGAFRASENFDMTSGEINEVPTKADESSNLPSSLRGPTLPLTGYLDKQGHIFKSWKRRYVVLDVSSIKYYDDADESTRVGILDLARSLTKTIRRLSFSRIFSKVKIKGMMHIDRHSKVVCLPEDVTGRKFCVAVISNKYDVGAVDSSGGSSYVDDEDIAGSDDNIENDESASKESFDIIDNERKVSLRLSFPDEVTMNIWISSINQVIVRLNDMLVKVDSKSESSRKSIIGDMDEGYFDRAEGG